MSPSLPICAAFHSKRSGKYLRCHADESQLVQLSGDDAVNPYTRFYIEPSTKHDGLVHVRCCYNNKYWVAEQRPNHDDWWIAGSAHEPEEDLSLESCTLFQLKTEGEETNTIRQTGPSKAACSLSEHFTMVNLLEKLLPKHVCFKGDNGLYLRAVEMAVPHNMLIFSLDSIEDRAGWHTTTTNIGSTGVRIKSQTLGQLWRRNLDNPAPNWVIPDSTGTSDDGDRNTTFKIFLLDDGPIIGLLNLGNNRYCRMVTDGLIRGLEATTENTAEPEAKFLLEEPVVSREMSVMQFRLQEARVYNVAPVILATASATNLTASPRMVKLTFHFTLTETRRWSSSMTLRTPVTTTISSQVPSMVDSSGIVVGPDHFTGMYMWGAVNEKTSQETAVQFVVVPGKSKVTATLSAMASSYDVPFSYRQADTLMGGGQDIFEFNDGIYTGRNAHSLVYNYQTQKI